MVLGDETGTVVDLGAGLRKNNTGVDWKQVFIGTAGAFGIITECTFNLERLPLQTATAYLVPRSHEQVTVLLNAMEQRLGNYLSAFEGMSGAAITHTLAHVEALRNPFPGGSVPDFVILAEVSRSWLRRETEQTLEAVLEDVLGAIWDQPDEPLRDAFVGPAREMWALRHALSEGVKSAGYLVGLDLSFRRGDVMRFRAQMSHVLAKEFPTVEICDFGHIGDGGVHFNLLVACETAGTVDAAWVDALRDRVISIAVEEHRGSFSAEHGLGRRNQLEPRLRDRILTVNGVSKAYAMTGWRIGYGAGPRPLIKAMAVVQSQSTSNPSSVSQAAAIEALTGPQDFLTERRESFRARRDVVVERLSGIEGIECRVPEGAFYTFSSCAGLIGKVTRTGQTLRSDSDLCKYLLEHARVAVVPGSAFGLSPFFRISYATSRQELEEATRRIAEACAGLTGAIA